MCSKPDKHVIWISSGRCHAYSVKTTLRSKRHYDALLRPMTKKELGESMGMTEGTMKSGPWHGAIKELVVNRLVIDQSGQLRRVEEELATA